ncbi:hypothetical protein CC2G_012661 [Coprinopsis cinerea AmutBmut pab1-1]|nr:hypothetical protein CC2G_012661 [Coprinopsis cinerea AmutBmut pab1-1]
MRRHGIHGTGHLGDNLAEPACFVDFSDPDVPNPLAAGYKERERFSALRDPALQAAAIAYTATNDTDAAAQVSEKVKTSLNHFMDRVAGNREVHDWERALLRMFHTCHWQIGRMFREERHLRLPATPTFL